MDPYPGRYAEQVLEPRRDSAWQLIKSYWQSEHRFPAYLFCTIVMAMTISLVGLNVFFTYWYYYFYEVLQGYDKHGAVRLAAALIMLAIIYAIWAIYRFYVSRLVRTHGRRLTENLIGRWLHRHGYRRAANDDEHLLKSNPRIQKDVDAVVNFSIDLSMGLIGTITTFFALTYILWQLSEEFALSLGRFGTVHIPGYLVWVGVVYAVAGTFCTLKFGRPLVSLPGEANSRSNHFVGRIRKKLLWLRVGGYQLTLIVPLLVVLPTFLDKLILITWLIQSLQAFNRVQGSLSSIVRSYPIVANGNIAEM